MQPGDRIIPWGMFIGAYLPAGLAAYPKISATSKIVWAMLNRHAGDTGLAWPSANELATECGASTRAVSRSLAELFAAGLIYKHGTRNRRVVWGFLWHDCFESSLRNVQSSERGSMSKVQTTPQTTPKVQTSDVSGPDSAANSAQCADDSLQNVQSIVCQNGRLPSLLERTMIESHGTESSTVRTSVGITCAPPENARAPDDESPRAIFLDLFIGARPRDIDIQELDYLIEEHGEVKVRTWLLAARRTKSCRMRRVIPYLHKCADNDERGISGYAEYRDDSYGL